MTNRTRERVHEDLQRQIVESIGDDGLISDPVVIDHHDAVISLDEVAEREDGRGWQACCGCGWSASGGRATPVKAAGDLVEHLDEALRLRLLEKRLARIESALFGISGVLSQFGEPVDHGVRPIPQTEPLTA